MSIQNFLPHREPMLMVDEIIEIDENSVITCFEITGNNIFIKNEIFVEAGLIENIAQTCSSITGQNFFIGDKENASTRLIGFITNIKKIQVFKLPKTGDKIITKANLISQFDKICNLSCETFLDNELLITAEINLFIQEIEP